MTSGEIKSSPGRLRPRAPPPTPAGLAPLCMEPARHLPATYLPHTCVLNARFTAAFLRRVILSTEGEVCTPGPARVRASAANNP